MDEEGEGERERRREERGRPREEDEGGAGEGASFLTRWTGFVAGGAGACFLAGDAEVRVVREEEAVGGGGCLVLSFFVGKDRLRGLDEAAVPAC
jgi:hypothetical protein